MRLSVLPYILFEDNLGQLGQLFSHITFFIQKLSVLSYIHLLIIYTVQNFCFNLHLLVESGMCVCVRTRNLKFHKYMYKYVNYGGVKNYLYICNTNGKHLP